MTMRGTHASHPSRFIMARSRGAMTGPLLMLLGAWGAIIPFVGHYFGYGFSPSNTWTWTAARGWLEVLPGAATFVGGALITVSAHRMSAAVGGWLAAASGAWFILGTVVGPLWSPGAIGTPSGGTTLAVLERIGMFSGLGLVIVFLAAVALGRTSVIGVRDVAASRAHAVTDTGVAYPATGSDPVDSPRAESSRTVDDGARTQESRAPRR